MASDATSSCPSSELKRSRQPSECSPEDVMWCTGSSDSTSNTNPNKKIRNGNTNQPPWSDSSGPDRLSPESLHQSQPAAPQEQPDSDAGMVNGTGDPLATNQDAPMRPAGNGLSYEEVNHMNESNAQANDGNADDDVSAISDLSGLSGEAWKPTAGPMAWVHRHIEAGTDPRELLQKMVPSETVIPEDLDNMTLWRIILNLVAEPPRRKKLKHVNTMEDVISLLKSCSRVMVLTGAGVSVSCGIPDFRSKDGIYARLAEEYPDLPDPQAMFDIHYFTRNQGPFFKFAKEIYPGQFEPSQSHKFIRLIESHNKLLRNYTQNIDTLEQVAGIERVVQCHGSFATATCMTCKHKAQADDIKQDIMNQVIPRCPECPPEEPLAIMKPDIVFFGESLPEHFHRQMELDKDVCDLLIVMGSSLKVRPVALIPNSLPAEVPQILINREPLRHLTFDVELLGDCDSIINELCSRLGEEWTSICTTPGPLRQVDKGEIITPPPSGQTTPITRWQEGGQHSTDGECSMDVDSGVAGTSDSAMQGNGPLSRTAVSVGQGSQEAAVTQTEAHTSSPDAHSSQDSVPMHSKDSSSPVQTHTPSTSTDQSITAPASTEQPMQTSSESPTPTSPPSSVSHPASTAPSHTEPTADPSQPHAAVSTDSTAAAPDSEQPGSSGPGRPNTDMDEAEMADMAELEALRACWRPRVINLGSRLPDGTFLFLPPNRYVFRGAEVYEDEDDDESSMSSRSSSSSASSSEQQAVAADFSRTEEDEVTDEVTKVTEEVTKVSEVTETPTSPNAPQL